MAIKGMLTGMCGVYLAAAELSRRGFVVTPTARNAKAADLLATDQACQRAYSVQVKTNAATFNHFLLGADAGAAKSDSHVYIFINLRDQSQLLAETTEFFVVPGLKLGKVQWAPTRAGGKLYGIKRSELIAFQDGWEEAFGAPVGVVEPLARLGARTARARQERQVDAR